MPFYSNTKQYLTAVYFYSFSIIVKTYKTFTNPFLLNQPAYLANHISAKDVACGHTSISLVYEFNTYQC